MKSIIIWILMMALLLAIIVSCYIKSLRQLVNKAEKVVNEEIRIIK